jgi:hypothetical protein
VKRKRSTELPGAQIGRAEPLSVTRFRIDAAVVTVKLGHHPPYVRTVHNKFVKLDNTLGKMPDSQNVPL